MIDQYLILICQAVHMENMFAEKRYNFTCLTCIYKMQIHIRNKVYIAQLHTQYRSNQAR